MQPKNRNELKELVDNWRELNIVPNEIDTSFVTKMNGLFKNMDFNEPIDQWNTENVTDMRYMFSNATLFNQPLPWDTGNVVYMGNMFENARDFDQPLIWNTKNVKNMRFMFNKAESFDQPLEWDTKNVKNMRGMFYHAESFNQPIGHWNTGNVTDMGYMFYSAISFNQKIAVGTRCLQQRPFIMGILLMGYKGNGVKLPIEMLGKISEYVIEKGWDIGKVKSMNRMFKKATAFNHRLEQWDLSHVITRNMFT